MGALVRQVRCVEYVRHVETLSLAHSGEVRRLDKRAILDLLRAPRTVQLAVLDSCHHVGEEEVAPCPVCELRSACTG